MDYDFAFDPAKGGCSAVPCWIYRKVLGVEPWDWACKLHDISYAWGGTREDKREADLLLCQRVGESGQVIIAALMLISVHVFGGPWNPLSYRWRFKSKYLRFIGYQPLSAAERAWRDEMMAEQTARLVSHD